VRRIFKGLILPITLLLSLSKGALTLLMVGSLALSLATVTVSGVFSTLSSAVEAVTGPRTVRARHQARLHGLSIKNAELKTRNDKLAAENGRVKRALADTRVTYRGRVLQAREAVKDTSGRLARRVTIASSRNAASVFAEALPFVGVGVIVAATAWELNDSCEMMKDLHELDVAFNPESAIDGTEVCGTRVPDRAEVWQAIRESPLAAWNEAQEYMPDLPDLSEEYASGSAWVTEWACMILACEMGEVSPE